MAMPSGSPSNPYTYIKQYYNDGLDDIIAHLSPPTEPEFNMFINGIYNYLTSVFFSPTDSPDQLKEQQIKIAINGIVTSYIYSNRYVEDLKFNDLQMQFATQLVNGVVDVKNPEDIREYILDIEKKILLSKLTPSEQVSLLYATAVGVAAYDYWKVKGFDSGGPWNGYVSSFTPAIDKFTVWISASMEAALIGNNTVRTNSDNSIVTGMFGTMMLVEGFNIVTLVGGILAVTAGKVIYKWTQNPA